MTEFCVEINGKRFDLNFADEKDLFSWLCAETNIMFKNFGSFVEIKIRRGR